MTVPCMDLQVSEIPLARKAIVLTNRPNDVSYFFDYSSSHALAGGVQFAGVGCPSE